MTPEQQRIAIAEACGWEEVEPWLNGDRCFELASSICGYRLEDIPDYLNDLNAIHEAEKHAIIGPIVRGGKSLLTPYCEMLEGVAEDKESAMVATAAQRAEAFLKTLNLWKP